MTRMIRGSVLLAACIGLWSCSSDTTADQAAVPYQVTADPSIVIVNADASQLVKFRLEDQLGGTIPSTWSIGATPIGFNVVLDSSYRPVYNTDGTLVLPSEQTEVRVTLTGLVPSSSEFTVTASGKTVTVPVTVIHANLPATFSTVTPNTGDTLVMTMPAGLTLQPSATYSNDAGDPIVVSQALDGSSVRLLMAPGTMSPIEVSGITPDYAPSVTLSLATSDTIVATGATTYLGTDVLSTAPLVALPGALGESISWYDIAQTSPQFYKFVVTDTTTLETTIDWQDAGGDIDVAWYTAAGAFLGYFGAGSSAHPEVSTHTFAPGSYVIGPEVYAGGTGDWYKFTITVVPAP